MFSLSILSAIIDIFFFGIIMQNWHVKPFFPRAVFELLPFQPNFFYIFPIFPHAFYISNKVTPLSILCSITILITNDFTSKAPKPVLRHHPLLLFYLLFFFLLPPLSFVLIPSLPPLTALPPLVPSRYCLQRYFTYRLILYIDISFPSQGKY